jgi:hypothetical protein
MAPPMKKTLVAMLFLSLGLAAPRQAQCVDVEIPLPAAEAYRKAILTFRNMGTIPTYLDESQLIIKTDSTLTRLTEKEADCGSRLGLPYIKDNKVKTGVSYEVQFKGIDEKNSLMEARAFIDARVDYYDSPSMIGDTDGGPGAAGATGS